eukprot:3458880-Amphidinium_carterae.1
MPIDLLPPNQNPFIDVPFDDMKLAMRTSVQIVKSSLLFASVVWLVHKPARQMEIVFFGGAPHQLLQKPIVGASARADKRCCPLGPLRCGVR